VQRVQDAAKQASNKWKRKPEELMPQAILPDIEDLRRYLGEFHAGLALLSIRVPHDARHQAVARGDGRT